jgi:uncharacterized membrane protein required for colicin V production
MNIDLPFNWFDILIVIVLAAGIRQGRKHGISAELITTLKWLAIAIGCAFVYNPVGTVIANGSVFSLLSAYLMAYVVIASVIAVAFTYLKKSVGGKLIGSDAFGGSEFYLGMAAGVIRFACILIAGVALLNARYYNPAEIRAAQKYQNDVYGSNFFPSLYEVQAQVFEESLVGPFIKSQLGFLLIKATAPEVKKFKQREFAAP